MVSLGILRAARPAVAILAVAIAASVLAGGCTQRAEGVLVYSARNEQLIKPLFDLYTQETGVPVRFVTDDAGPLIERLGAEGADTTADVLMTVDAGELWYAAERDLLKPIDSPMLKANIPEHFRDPGNRWFGLSVRARTVVYSTERVKPEDLSTYEALADPRWKGKVCLRTSKKVYNQSLVAMLISEHGEQQTETIVRGWVDNLATNVFSNDVLLMEAIAAGQCDVGIVNTYYFGRLLRDKPELPVRLFWPDQQGQGVHVNISGAGVTKYSRHEAAARKLLEWLSEPKAQALFAGQNMEYPANPAIKADPAVLAWGDFKHSEKNIAQAGALQADAVRLMDRVGYK
jgi:iron(III) transport system substrate-binding protein